MQRMRRRWATDRVTSLASSKAAGHIQALQGAQRCDADVSQR